MNFTTDGEENDCHMIEKKDCVSSQANFAVGRCRAIAPMWIHPIMIVGELLFDGGAVGLGG